VLSGVDALHESRCDAVFAFVRPPGHHAEPDRGMGFCLFNNIAVGAAYAVRRYSYDRVLIVDWDLHHGNGTQKAFYEDPRVLYFSTHQYPYYPGSGSLEETGRGEGAGFTVNVPLSTGAGDEEYREIFERVLVPIALAYGPQLVMVSAGFDAHRADPLGGMMLSPAGYGALTRILMQVAERTAGGKLLFALEGGYDLGGLRESVKSVLQELSGAKSGAASPAGAGPTGVSSLVERVLTHQRTWWSGI
jgi:acetoin utilization deacetylase AcuC-like enzyme